MEDGRSYCVYKHTSPSGKVYIGMTGTKPEYRWNYGKGYKQQPYFWNAIQKYGWDNFEHIILATQLTKSEAEELEIQLIATYRSNQSEYGYNCDNGGSCVGKVSEATKQKMSAAKKGKPPNNKGIKRSEHARKKASESLKGANNPRYGVVVSEETRRKLSEANKGHVSTQRVAVVCVETGIVYASGAAAAAATHTYQSGITRCCKGQRGSAKGYHWRYATEEEIECLKF